MSTKAKPPKTKQPVCNIPKKPCPLHANEVHGAEAEELRNGVAKIIRRCLDDGYNGVARELQDMLNEVDARDSLAFVEDVDGTIVGKIDVTCPHCGHDRGLKFAVHSARKP